MKLKKGQKVYYFKLSAQYMGEIISGTITKATKDMFSGTVSYVVESSIYSLLSAWGSSTCETVSEENLYTKLKKIQRDYKEYLIYGTLLSKLDRLERTLDAVMRECAEKISLHTDGIMLMSGEFAKTSVRISNEDLFIDGVGNVGEEIKKMKASIDSLKKKIKTPKKKPVVKSADDNSSAIKEALNDISDTQLTTDKKASDNIFDTQLTEDKKVK